MVFQHSFSRQWRNTLENTNSIPKAVSLLNVKAENTVNSSYPWVPHLWIPLAAD